MFEPINKFNKNMTWEIKNYLLIYLVTAVNTIFYILLAFLDIDVIDGGFVGGAYLLYAIIETLFVIHSSLIVYGIISYKRIKKIIFPHVLLFLTFFLLAFGVDNIRDIGALYFDLDMLTAPFVATLLSLIPSIITAMCERLQKHRKAKGCWKSEKSDTTLSEESELSVSPPVKTKIQYIKLFTFWGAVLLGFFVSTMIKTEGIYHSLAYMLYICPICAAIYGFLAYKLTKKILIPNLFLAFILAVTYIIASFITLGAEIGEFFEVLKVSLIVCAPFLIISLIFSGAPHLVKSKKRSE